MLKASKPSNKSGVWLGVSDHESLGVFKWSSTGKEVVYDAPWEKGFSPGVSNPCPSCFVMPHYDYSIWVYRHFRHTAEFICKKDFQNIIKQETEKHSVVDGSVEWGKNNHLGGSKLTLFSKRVINRSLTWNTSKDFCEQRNMTLVYVDTEAKLKFISSAFANRREQLERIWLGGVGPNGNGWSLDFVWINYRKLNLMDWS